MRISDWSSDVCSSDLTYLGRLIAAFPEEEAGLRRCIKVMRIVAADEIPRLRPFMLLRWGVRPITKLMAACRLSADAQAVILAENGDYTWPPQDRKSTRLNSSH